MRSTELLRTVSRIRSASLSQINDIDDRPLVHAKLVGTVRRRHRPVQPASIREGSLDGTERMMGLPPPRDAPKRGGGASVKAPGGAGRIRLVWRRARLLAAAKQMLVYPPSATGPFQIGSFRMSHATDGFTFRAVQGRRCPSIASASVCWTAC